MSDIIKLSIPTLLPSGEVEFKRNNTRGGVTVSKDNALPIMSYADAVQTLTTMQVAKAQFGDTQKADVWRASLSLIAGVKNINNKASVRPHELAKPRGNGTFDLNDPNDWKEVIRQRVKLIMERAKVPTGNGEIGQFYAGQIAKWLAVEGNSVHPYVIKTDDAGKPVLDEQGNPVMVQDKERLIPRSALKSVVVTLTNQEKADDAAESVKDAFESVRKLTLRLPVEGKPGEFKTVPDTDAIASFAAQVRDVVERSLKAIADGKYGQADTSKGETKEYTPEEIAELFSPEQGEGEPQK